MKLFYREISLEKNNVFWSINNNTNEKQDQWKLNIQ